LQDQRLLPHSGSIRALRRVGRARILYRQGSRAVRRARARPPSNATPWVGARHRRRSVADGRAFGRRAVAHILRRGGGSDAQEAYERAFHTYKDAGLLRRASTIAYRLLVLTGEHQYEEFIVEALRGVSEEYWVKARLAKSRTEARLSKRHLDILPLVAQGMTNKEIGAVRGRSELTARNTVREAIRLLGVTNRTPSA
jgi:DNA-binding NarL/FixJ family response regulator